VGEWSIADAVTPDAAAWSRVLPLKEILRPFPGLELGMDEAQAISRGQPISRTAPRDAVAWHDGLPIALLLPLSAGTVRARKVL
jgi:hypothetical protein